MRSTNMIKQLSFRRSFVYVPIVLIIIFSANFHLFFFNPIPFSPNNNDDHNETVPCGPRNPSNFTKRERGQRWRIEEGLARAREAILKATRTKTYTSYKKETYIPRGPVYFNPYAFHQSHIEMEKRFRVWGYKEGDIPIYHTGPMKSIYSTEGIFINELESESSPFLAQTPQEALAFFVPVSVANIIRYVYLPYKNYSRKRLQRVVEDYISIVSHKYPFWNASNGADHFLVSCHDWAPDISRAHPDLFKNFIRVLCNANSSEGFKPVRDVSLPEINLKKGESGLLTKPPQNRSMLAFFAGGRHGHVRAELFKHWKDRNNTEIVVHEYLPKTLNYEEEIRKSRFCLCPSGYEVASPRVVEAIHGGCVPVIISTSYVLPFSDVLDWTRFSVQVSVERIPEIEEILKEISEEKYLEMIKMVSLVQRHFMVNHPPQPFDFMYMVMHSLWLRRLNIMFL